MMVLGVVVLLRVGRKFAVSQLVKTLALPRKKSKKCGKLGIEVHWFVSHF